MAGVLVVTGGGRGIGAAVCRMAAARGGYAVCVNYRERAADAEAVAGAIREAGGRAIAVRADVAREDEVVRLFATVDSELGPLTALVNNVGVIGGQCRVDEVEGRALAELFAINVFSCFYCAREAVRRMSTRHGGKGGAIVNVSSAAAKLGGFNGRVRYATTKGAVETFTMGLAREVAEEGIRVNAVRPGPTATAMHDPYGGAGFLEAIKAKLPLRRVGRPEEIANAVLWLLSDDSSFATATVIEVSGGQ
ncbi:MAG: SDR family oxidoreductase [Proteobacteria bacterium]|nr:SDR family oxidoreductase [Pseudomonadota bacterium]